MPAARVLPFRVVAQKDSSAICAAILLIALCALFPVQSFAHGVFIFGWEEGGRICTESYFSKSQKVRQGTVLVLDSEKNILAQGEPDANGLWCTPTPAGQKEVTLVVNAGEGHRGEFRLDISGAPATPRSSTASSSPDTGNLQVIIPIAHGEPLENAPRVIIPQKSEQRLEPGAAGQRAITVTPEELRALVSESVRTEVAPLYKILAEMQQANNAPSLATIGGGIGWIVGLCGVGALLLRRPRGPWQTASRETGGCKKL